MMLTADDVRAALDYDETTGTLVWRSTGRVAGNINDRGYRVVYVAGKSYKAHRLIWLWAHGQWPPAGIDHVNGRRDDNRLANLREATGPQNRQNLRNSSTWSRTGYLGVSKASGCNRWFSTIAIDGTSRYLGCYPTPEAAHEAYVAAKRSLHPFAAIGGAS